MTEITLKVKETMKNIMKEKDKVMETLKADRSCVKIEKAEIEFIIKAIEYANN